MNTQEHEAHLPPALVLSIQIRALREALHCVTDPAAPGVIYGRIDSLINDRQRQMEALAAQAVVQAQEACHV